MFSGNWKESAEPFVSLDIPDPNITVEGKPSVWLFFCTMVNVIQGIKQWKPVALPLKLANVKLVLGRSYLYDMPISCILLLTCGTLWKISADRHINTFLLVCIVHVYMQHWTWLSALFIGMKFTWWRVRYALSFLLHPCCNWWVDAHLHKCM